MTRPATARTNTGRPGTSRPGTKHTDTSDTAITVALFESRGVAREVGIAAMDRDTGRVVLVQVLILFHQECYSHRVPMTEAINSSQTVPHM